MEELAKLGPMMDQLVGQLREAQSLSDTETAHQLEQLLGQLQEHHGRFVEEVQKANTAADQMQAKARQKAEDTLKNIEQEEQRFAAAKAEAKKLPKSPPEPPPLDPNLGPQLAAELLNRFGGLPTAQRDYSSDIWQMIDEWKQGNP